MSKIQFSKEARKAIYIGAMCFLSYIPVSLGRNILGTVTPQMIESGAFTTEQIGFLSSVYFIVYAIGQLINGMIGDKLKGRYMITFGLALSGICNLLFTVFHASSLTTYIAYGAVGFFLSMIYGSMAKTVAENLEPLYATRCSIGYVFISFLGSPLAGILAAFLTWQAAFYTTSGMLITMAILYFFIILFFEKKGIVRYGEYIPKEKGLRNIKTLIHHKIIRFTFVSIITGIVRTSVVFWLPTYITQYLGFSPDRSALLFTVVTIVISTSAFLALFLFERLFKRNMELTITVTFIIAAISFLGVYLIPQAVINLTFMTLGILASNCATTIMVSRYCPSLKETGLVSTVAGYLDFISYLSAAISSVIFANAIASIGWDGLILVWFFLTAAGIFTMAPLKKKVHKLEQ